MPTNTIRIGLIGAGANMKLRHIPGLRAIDGIEIAAVCNRRRQSAEAVARECNIERVFDHWKQVVDAPDLDAIVIGTWPYLHCPITLGALERGKHVLTEARMALNAKEAHQMHEAARRHSNLVTQIVPSPFGLKGHDLVKETIESGGIGQLREIHVHGMAANLMSSAVPLGWRQDAALSGYNMLTLGILHETVSRWVPPVVRVLAQVHAFVPTRIDPASGVRRAVGTPDSVQVLTVHEDGSRGVYQFSGVTHLAPGMGIRLYGTEGTLWYDIDRDRLFVSKAGQAEPAADLQEVPLPNDRARYWRVEAEFIDAIRDGKPIEFTDFATGVQYMEFTEAVARSAQTGTAVELPLAEFAE